MLGRDTRNLVEPEIDRIGAYAIRKLGETREIVLNLSRRDHDGGVEWRLAAPERRVGYAIELFTAPELGWHQKHRTAKPSPDTGYSYCRNREAGKSMAHWKPIRR